MLEKVSKAGPLAQQGVLLGLMLWCHGMKSKIHKYGISAFVKASLKEVERNEKLILAILSPRTLPFQHVIGHTKVAVRCATFVLQHCGKCSCARVPLILAPVSQKLRGTCTQWLLCWTRPVSSLGGEPRGRPGEPHGSG